MTSLYEAWLDITKTQAKLGNRYQFICILFEIACKCGISFDKAYNDACSLIDILNEGVSDNQLFTEEDVKSASEYYLPKILPFITIEFIEFMTNINLDDSFKTLYREGLEV